MIENGHNYASFKLLLLTDFVEVADALISGWVFRGQANARWDISSSLEREVNRLYKPDPTRWLDNMVQSEFERTALKRIKSLPPFDQNADAGMKDDFSWLALLQHHGCKTRMVDFTESFYVALYFAIRDLPGHDAAVWAIGTAALDDRRRSIDPSQSGLPSEEIPRRLVNNSIECPDRYVGDESLAIAYCKPDRPSQRMIAQQGLFLCPLNLKRSFKENLTKDLGLSRTKQPVMHLHSLDELRAAAKQEKVIKIRIPHSAHESILSHLRKMTISDATLFPGLDGYARSLNYYVGKE